MICGYFTALFFTNSCFVAFRMPLVKGLDGKLLLRVFLLPVSRPLVVLLIWRFTLDRKDDSPVPWVVLSSDIATDHH